MVEAKWGSQAAARGLKPFSVLRGSP